MKDYFVRVDEYWSYRPVFIIVISCLIVFFIWASFTEIDEHVRATGRVIPSGKIRVIQHLEGGIINAINVVEGGAIKKGDVLFYIKNQNAESELQELIISLNAFEIKKIRLLSELNEDDNLTYSSDFNDKYFGIIESEKQIFQDRKSEYKSNLEVFNKRIAQKILRLNELDSSIKSIKRELLVANEQLEIKSKLRKKGAASRSQYLDVFSTVRELETRILKSKKEKPIVKSEISELSNIINENKQKRRSEVGEEIVSVKISIRKLKERIQTLEDQVIRTSIKSPVDGLVNKIYINTIGGIVQPGGKLAEIIPINETLIIEGKVSTNDRGKIWPGLSIMAKITAYDYTIYGGVSGNLDYISADSFTDNQNQEYYQIRASLNKSDLGLSQVIYPGMTVDISIISGKISILHAILKPFWVMQNKALREI